MSRKSSSHFRGCTNSPIRYVIVCVTCFCFALQRCDYFFVVAKFLFEFFKINFPIILLTERSLRNNRLLKLHAFYFYTSNIPAGKVFIQYEFYLPVTGQELFTQS